MISKNDQLSMLGRQAKILSDDNIRDLLAFADRTRYPARNRVIVLLSVKAGLRAGEIAKVTWAMAGNIGPAIALEDRVAKKHSSRIIPIHRDLRDALMILRAARPQALSVITSERGRPITPASIVNWFGTAYRTIGLGG